MFLCAPRFYVHFIVLLAGLSSVGRAQPSCSASLHRFGVPPVIFDDFVYADALTPSEGAGTASLFGATWWRTSSSDSVHTKAWYRGNRYDLPVNSISVQEGVVHLVLPAAPTNRQRSPGFSSSFLTRTGTYVAHVWMDRFEGGGAIQAFWLYSLGTLRFPRSHGGSVDYATELDLEFTPEFSSDGRPRLYVSNKVRKTYKGFDQVDGELNCVDAHRGAYPDCLDRDGHSVFGGRWVYLTIRVTDSAVEYAFSAPVAEDGRPAIWGGGPDARPSGAPLDSGSPARAVWGVSLKLADPAYLPSRDVASIFSLLYFRSDEKPLDKTYRMLADWYLFSPCPSLSITDAASIAEAFRARGIPRANTTHYATHLEEPAPATPHAAEIIGPDEISYGEEGTWTVSSPLRGSTFLTTYRYRWVNKDGTVGPWIAVYAPSLTLRAPRRRRGVEFEATLLDYWFPNGPGALNNHHASTRRRAMFVR